MTSYIIGFAIGLTLAAVLAALLWWSLRLFGSRARSTGDHAQAGSLLQSPDGRYALRRGELHEIRMGSPQFGAVEVLGSRCATLERRFGTAAAFSDDSRRLAIEELVSAEQPGAESPQLNWGVSPTSDHRLHLLMRTPSEIMTQLARGPETLRAVVADVPPADLKRRPRPEKWSAHEHACHLALVEPLWAERLERILVEDVPTIVSYEPDADEPPDRLLNMNLEAALDSYTHGRKAFLRRLAVLTPAEWARGAVNTAHARYSLFLMCRHAALHDMLHAYRVEESALGTYWPAERIPT